jgi:hypothetical protein
MEESPQMHEIEAQQDSARGLKQNLPASEWDSLLRKYTYVWIWSVLLGSVTTVAFTFISYGGGRWGPLGSGLILFTMFGAASVVISLSALGKFFSGYLLPVFFGAAEVKTDESLRAALLLKRSFRYLIFSIIIRFIMSAVEQLLSATSRLG